MKKIIMMFAALAMTMGANAQGNNIGMGGGDGDIQSIHERITKLEKKNDMFNLYFNYAASFQAEHNSLSDEWGTKFANKQLRIEIKGNLTDKLYYRLRHRLNKATDAKGEDNFAKATDIMMVGYNFNDKLSISGGKMCQIWGGFEFDENPMYIYQYSDMVDYMDNFMAGVTVSYKPIPTQEIAVEISNSYNGKFADEYGDEAVVVNNDEAHALQKSKNPLTYIINWNGSFFDGKLNTRWAWGLQTQAKGKYSRMLTLGQQLNLPKFQWYFDYMGAFDDLDRLKIATNELRDALVGGDAPGNVYLGKVHYNSFITKANWQFAPSWNLMLKGMYETASVTKMEQFKNYRKSFGYMGSIEYYPAKQQDFRLFLAYVGRKYDYSTKCGLKDYNTDRIELGFMYRIKAY
ncbi:MULTISPECIES: porin [Prevotellaceae]|uniref:porin n=1 Tax=Segatella intestinalis TaxID=3035284 RepID=UPI0023ECB116|nr:porin [Prevotella sp. B2-R-102]MDF4241920.1 porin [Prevotella sp. B2-R-102]